MYSRGEEPARVRVAAGEILREPELQSLKYVSVLKGASHYKSV